MIAPSRLGQAVLQVWGSEDSDLIAVLRKQKVVRAEVTDDELKAVFRAVEVEHEAFGSGKEFNSPWERVRVQLAPYLRDKGHRWAVPLDSLELWWKFWK